MQVTKWVSFYKQYRDILISDIVHIRRADLQDYDAFMHVNPTLQNRALAMVFNPTQCEAVLMWIAWLRCMQGGGREEHHAAAVLHGTDGHGADPGAGAGTVCTRLGADEMCAGGPCVAVHAGAGLQR